MSAGAARPARPSAGAGVRRAAVLAGAALVAAVDLTAKAWAQRALGPAGVETGVVDLRLAYNPGVAFSLGAAVPTGALLVLTGLLTAGVAAWAWRSAGTRSRLRHTALTGVLGGAVANLVDRAGDGVVTDYLHTGWWPTFNLADVAIVTGVTLLVLAEWRGRPGAPSTADTSHGAGTG